MRAFRVVLCLLTGCAAEAVVAPPEATQMQSAPSAPTAMPDAVTFDAQVCHVDAWPNVLGLADGAQLAVVPSVTGGATLMSIPAHGGPLTGFAFDQYGLITTDPAGTVIADGAYTSVRGAIVEQVLVAALGTGERIEVDAVSPDLSTTYTLATANGSMIGGATISHLDRTRVMATASASGVSLAAFDASWRETADLLAYRDAVIGFDTTNIAGTTGNTDVAWSTATACHVIDLVAQTEATNLDHPCAAPRLTPAGIGAADMVFETGEEIARYHLSGSIGDLKGAAYTGELGSAPRVVFDGAREWISFIGRDGSLRVGYIDGDGAFVGRTIEEQPTRDSFELAMVDGAPWVFTVNANGYFAYEMCRAPAGSIE